MKLLVVESPAKAKTIKSYLDSDFEVIASVGHIRDLPQKGIGIDEKNNFYVENWELDKKKLIQLSNLLNDQMKFFWPLIQIARGNLLHGI